MKLNTKFYLFIGALYGAISIVIFLERHYSEARITAQETLNTFERRHWAADMNHDAIRGDVLSVNAARENGNDATRDAAARDFKEHTRELEATLRENLKTENLPQNLKTALEEALKDANEYRAAGEAMMSLAPGAPAAKEELKAFFDLFKRMESSLGDITERTESWKHETDLAIQTNAHAVTYAAFALLTLGALAPLYASRILFLPQQRLTQAMMSLAGGDDETEIFGLGRTDEIGEMAEALASFKTQRSERKQEEQRAAEALAEAHQERRKSLEKVAHELEKELKAVTQASLAATRELREFSQGMSATVQNTTSLASRAGEEAGMASENVYAVATAAGQLSASVHEISSQLQKTNTLVSKSKAKASGADTLAGALSGATEKISAVMEMISNISGQINLLALNASIESARAGDAGKGFSVVANEVKNLAGQTDRSIGEIKIVMQEMHAASQEIIEAMSEILNSVDEISEAAFGVASAVEEQSSVTGEIALNMRAAAERVQSVSTNLTEVKVSSSQAGLAAGKVSEASDALSVQAHELNRKMDLFLSKLRAA